MSNHASVMSNDPVAPAATPTHGERRHAATAVSRKSNVSVPSNPDHAMSQRGDSCVGRSVPASQIVHGTRARPAAPKRRMTHSRSVEGRRFMLPTLSQR